jgi:branched-chain amino acid transport system substrate-binding protein
MRRYLNVLLLLVTFTVIGCATKKPEQTMRTPSGTVISDRVPDFGTESTDATQAPLATSQNGRASVTPYYNPASPDKQIAEAPSVKIGIIVPLSGPQGDLGQAMLNAAQLALFDMNANNITIVPRDSTSGAARAASEVIAEGAQIILGPLFAQDVKAVTPVAKAQNVPVLAFSTDWSAASDNTYIMGFLPFGQVSRVVNYAIKKGAVSFGALIPETPYGVAVNSSLKNELQRQKLNAPYSLIFNPSTGLQSAVGQISQTKVDALLIPVGGAQLSQSATLLRQNDTDLSRTRLIGTGLWDDSPQAAAQLRGGWFAAPDPKLRVSFTRQYSETYGQLPPRLATLAYDATALATALAVKGQNETGKPAFSRADLTNPNGFSGLDGVFRFRPDGLAERGLAVLELGNNGAVVIDPAPTHF